MELAGRRRQEMHYGEFRIEYFINLAEKEALPGLYDEGEAVARKRSPEGSAFPWPFALALVAVAVATAVVAIVQL
jgi:hypothetical protein